MRHGIIDDQRKTLSELRKKLRSAGFANAETLVPQRGPQRLRLLVQYRQLNRHASQRCASWRFINCCVRSARDLSSFIPDARSEALRAENQRGGSCLLDCGKKRRVSVLAHGGQVHS